MQEIEIQKKEYLTQIKKILGDKGKELKPNKSPYDFYYENKYDNFRETIILDLQFPEDEGYYCIEKKNSLSIIFVMKYKNVSLTEFLEKTKQVKKIGELMENKKNILSESKVTYSPDSLAVSGTNLDVETIKNGKGPYGSEKEKNNE